MPRIIPVLDVLRGRAVHARGGRRSDYRPVRSALRRGSDPLALATAFRETLGLHELYLADLDAILGASPAIELYRDLAGLGLAAWVDAGLRDESAVSAILAAGAARAIAGLETLAGRLALRSIIDAAGPDRAVLSLDLRDGRPVVAPGADWGTDDPRRLVEMAVAEGISSVILLDLARVGSGRGVGTLGLLEGIARDFPGVAWVVGGGVAGRDEIEALGRAGASAVLVGSAIHDGRIAPGRLGE
jgi:phosphoribosylformimino-5-aminoimidazole carboxamide ribotide isomerase